MTGGRGVNGGRLEAPKASHDGPPVRPEGDLRPARLLTNPFEPAGVRVVVPGRPRPQGSKRAVGRRRNGSAILVESSPGVGDWRADVRAAMLASGARLAGPVSVGLDFALARPRSPTHPAAPAGPPDLDKLARAVLDALESAGTIENDARVVQFHLLRKRYAAPGEPQGCLIEVRSLS